MRIAMIVAALLLATPAALAQQGPEIDLDAVEKRLAACRATPIEDALAARLEAHGLGMAPAGLDNSLGVAVNAFTGPELNPERAAAGLAGLLAGNGGDAALHAAVAYYVLKDMTFYGDLNCQSLEREYRRVVVFADLRETSPADDPLMGYYKRAELMSRGKIAQVLRAGRRLAEKEQALLKVLGLEGS